MVTVRVLMVAEVGSIHTRQFAHSLSRRGHEVVVVGALRPKDAAYVDGYEVRVEPIPVRWRADLARVPAAIRRVYRESSFDVVHAHYATSHGGAAVASRVGPLFVSVWGTDVMEFPTRSPLHRSLVQFVLNRAVTVFATSQDMAATTRQLTRVPVVVSPFGVDPAFYDLDLHPFGVGDEFVVGTVKTLRYVYGIDLLIRAFELFCERCSDPAVRLEIVGDGEDRAEIESQVSTSAVSNRIRLIGRVPHSEVAQHMDRFDVFAVLSRRESFGVAALEASAVGIPVVATRVGGLPEVVRDGKTGLLVPSESPEAAADAFLELYQNPELRAGFGRYGREMVRDNFTWDHTAAIVERTYAQVLGR